MSLDEALAEWLNSVARKLRQDLEQIARCARLLDSGQLWSRANAHCNSVGNLVLHLNGNVRQWIVAGLGGAAFERDRPAEFAERGPLPCEDVLARLADTVEQACTVITSLRPAALADEHQIQGYRVTALAAVFHVAEHFSFHTGQVVHMTKAIRDVDLSLYDAQGKRITRGGAQPW